MTLSSGNTSQIVKRIELKEIVFNLQNPRVYTVVPYGSFYIESFIFITGRWKYICKVNVKNSTHLIEYCYHF